MIGLQIAGLFDELTNFMQLSIVQLINVVWSRTIGNLML